MRPACCSDLLARIRRNLDRTAIGLRLARLARARRQWAWSRRFYRKLLASVPDDPKLTSKQIELITNEAKLHVSLMDRLLDLEAYRQDIEAYARHNRRPRTLRIAIVTAISRGYDSLMLPATLIPSCDYIVFCDQPIWGAGIYQVRPFPYAHPDGTRVARYVKANLPALLPDYDVAIWIDANIMVIGDIEPLIDRFLRSRRPVGAIPHPLRSSVFEEVAILRRNGKEARAVIEAHAEHLRAIGYDCHDLIESNFMMFDLRHERIRQFFAIWWAEIDRYSRRDQLSLNYALDTAGIAWHSLMERPLDVRTHPVFCRTPHDMDRQVVHDLEAALAST